MTAIKRFLSSPPVIRNALITYESHRSTMGGSYHIRYQSNGYLIRQVASVDLDQRGYGRQTGIVAGRFENDYWTFNPAGSLQRWHGVYHPGDEPNSVMNLQLFLQQLLHGYLSFGIEGMLPGTIVWDGLHFSGKRRLPSAPKGYHEEDVTGQLVVNSESGRVEAIRYRINDTSYVELAMEYREGATIDELPIVFDAQYVKQGMSRALYTYRVALLEISDTPLGSESFGSDSAALQGPVTEFVYTNGAVLWNASKEEGAPRFVPVERLPRPGTPQGPDVVPQGRWLILFFVGAGFVVIAAATVREFRKGRSGPA